MQWLWFWHSFFLVSLFLLSPQFFCCSVCCWKGLDEPNGLYLFFLSVAVDLYCDFFLTYMCLSSSSLVFFNVRKAWQVSRFLSVHLWSNYWFVIWSLLLSNQTVLFIMLAAWSKSSMNRFIADSTDSLHNCLEQAIRERFYCRLNWLVQKIRSFVKLFFENIQKTASLNRSALSGSTGMQSNVPSNSFCTLYCNRQGYIKHSDVKAYG